MYIYGKQHNPDLMHGNWPKRGVRWGSAVVWHNGFGSFLLPWPSDVGVATPARE